MYTCISSDVQYQIVVKQIYMHCEVKTFILEVAFSDTIEAIKVKIQEKERIPRECQQLDFAQKELKGGHTLRDYNILESTQLSLRTTEWEGKQLLYHTLHVVSNTGEKYFSSMRGAAENISRTILC